MLEGIFKTSYNINGIFKNFDIIKGQGETNYIHQGQKKKT